MYSFLRLCEAVTAARAAPDLAVHLYAPFVLRTYWARLRFGAERDGAEQTVKLLFERFEQRAARDVAVRDLLPLLVFELKEGLAAQGERPHGDTRVTDARDRLGEDELGERVEPFGEVGDYDAHAPNLSLSARCAAYSSFLL